jgi:hypothetical protein
MATTCRGMSATRAKDVTDALRGLVMMSIIFGAFIGILALQVYLVATFVDGLDAPAWLTTMTCIGVAVAGLSGLSLIPVYMEWRCTRRERDEIRSG